MAKVIFIIAFLVLAVGEVFLVRACRKMERDHYHEYQKYKERHTDCQWK